MTRLVTIVDDPLRVHTANIQIYETASMRSTSPAANVEDLRQWSALDEPVIRPFAYQLSGRIT